MRPKKTKKVLVKNFLIAVIVAGMIAVVLTAGHVTHAKNAKKTK